MKNNSKIKTTVTNIKIKIIKKNNIKNRDEDKGTQAPKLFLFSFLVDIFMYRFTCRSPNLTQLLLISF